MMSYGLGLCGLSFVDKGAKKRGYGLPRSGQEAEQPSSRAIRGERLHARNRRLINHRGFSVAFSNGCSMAVSNELSFVLWYFPKVCHFPSGFSLEFPMDLQRHFPMDLNCCEFWCVICCPSHPAGWKPVNFCRIPAAKTCKSRCHPRCPHGSRSPPRMDGRMGEGGSRGRKMAHKIWLLI